MQIKRSTNNEGKKLWGRGVVMVRITGKSLCSEAEVLSFSCSILDEILRGSELGKHKS